MTSTVSLPLSQIHFEPGAWPRFSLDRERVEEFAGLYSEGGLGALPPLAVVPASPTEWILADGVHRHQALQSVGAKEAPVAFVDVPDGRKPIEVAYDHALATCATAAKPLTRSEKHGAIERLIRERPEASDREIGRLVGVAHTTVGRIRARCNAPSEDSAEDDPATPTASAQAREVARTLVRGLVRMSRSRGLLDLFSEARMGRHLAIALHESCGEMAPKYLTMFTRWFADAQRALDMQA